MKKRLFKTLIKKDSKFGENTYVIGRIDGIMSTMDGCIYKAYSYAHYTNDEGTILRGVFTKFGYRKFCKVIEKIYPDLCVFNYED